MLIQNPTSTASKHRMDAEQTAPMTSRDGGAGDLFQVSLHLFKIDSPLPVCPACAISLNPTDLA